MARIMSRSKPVAEGSTGLKFSEIIVIAMAIAGIVLAGRWYLEYRRSASFALQEYIGAIKSGNVGSQYALVDEGDKKNFYPSKAAYESGSTLSHGYTERIENASLGTEKKATGTTDKVTVPVTFTIRATSGGKQLYETGEKKSYSDNIVMRKGHDGNWRVLLSASVDKSTGKLHMQEATPSPVSNY